MSENILIAIIAGAAGVTTATLPNAVVGIFAIIDNRRLAKEQLTETGAVHKLVNGHNTKMEKKITKLESAIVNGKKKKTRERVKKIVRATKK